MEYKHEKENPSLQTRKSQQVSFSNLMTYYAMTVH